MCTCWCCLVAKSCLTLWPQGLLPARLLCPIDFSGKNTGVSCHFLLRGSSRPRDRTCVSCIGRWILYHWVTCKARLYAYLYSYILRYYVCVQTWCTAWLIQFAEKMVVKAFKSRTRTTYCKPHFSLQTFSLEFDASFGTLLLCQMVRWLWSRKLTMAELHRAVDVWLMQKQCPKRSEGK